MTLIRVLESFKKDFQEQDEYLAMTRPDTSSMTAALRRTVPTLDCVKSAPLGASESITNVVPVKSESKCQT
jgi:hypothetical protein